MLRVALPYPAAFFADYLKTDNKKMARDRGIKGVADYAAKVPCRLAVVRYNHRPKNAIGCLFFHLVK